MKAILSISLVLATSSIFAKTTKTQSVYTDLKKDCIVVSSATEAAPIDFFTSECKAFGGYTLKESGGDLRYGPELSFNGKEINLQRPSSFHNMGSSKIEWVYDLTSDEEGSGDIKFKALIYRLSVANIEDPYKEDTSVLYVIKLDGEKSCVIGTTKSNTSARALANNVSAPCATLER